ncbi:MAG: hypothetical protein RIG62_25915 [Cyclobacteriaceae bacterium]
MTLNNFFRYFFSVGFTLLFACHDDEEPITPPIAIDTTVTETPDSTVAIDLKGYVQKGPFINGTAITLSELNEKLIATGRNFTTQIADNKGSFSLKEIPLQTTYVQLQADGFYFDEVKGEKSAAQLTLFALADVSDASSVNVNLLSHLERNRVIYLMQEEEQRFDQAKQQAQQEILTVFGIAQDSIGYSEQLDISQEGDQHAILLAISAILQANNSVAELSELLANLITDLREDGVLNSKSIESTLKTQAISLNLPQIRTHLEQRYAAMGVSATIPNFEHYIDSDGDGILNKDEDDTPEDFSFETQVNVAVNDTLTSNTVTISGLKEGGIAVASVSNGFLVVNGMVASDTEVDVKNGDELQVQVVSSSQFIDSTKAILSIGTLVQPFAVVTDAYSPDIFSFTSISNAKRDSVYFSDTITISGLPHATPAETAWFVSDAPNGAIYVNGEKFNDNNFSLKEGDQVWMEVVSSEDFVITVTSSLTINDKEASFSVTTGPNPWQRIADFPSDEQPRSYFSIGETLYASDRSSNDLFTYTPSTDSWKMVGKIPFDPGIRFTVIDNKVYYLIQAGTGELDEETGYYNLAADLWELDTSTDQWAQKSSPELGFEYDGPLISCNGKIYHIDYLGDVLREYSPSSDTWENKGTLPPISTGYITAFSLENNVYMVFQNDNSEPTHGLVWEYSTTNNTWTQKSNIPLIFDGVSSFVTRNKAYVVPNSWSQEGLYAVYDQDADEWKILDGKPNDINSISSANVGYGFESNKFWKFTPPQN